MSEVLAPSVPRDVRIDALRALALAGILQVNIQSFVQGSASSLGEFLAPPSWLDAAAYFVVAAVFEYKFLPIFSLLFGAGFGLLYAKLQRSMPNPAAALRRRFAFLLAFGVCHGTLLYFGDITTVYAVLGLLLLFYARAEPPKLARSVLRWWIATLVINGGLVLLADIGTTLADIPPDDPARLLDIIAIFTAGTYLEQLPLRIGEFLTLTEGVFLYGQWVAVFAWMLTGLLAQRAGWLDRNAHADFDRPVLWLGLGVGLPCALNYAGLSLAAALDGPIIGSGAARSAWPLLLSMASGALAPMYVLMFLRHAPAAIVNWLAPAGRMPLTNYLLQSVAMGALLSGWGLGWGGFMTHAQLALLALVIVVVQWALSRLWMARFAQGPLEAAWRRVTYGAAAET